jgi:hypothetical protein
MKKLALTVSILLCGFFIVMACSKKGNDMTNPKNNKAKGVQQITYSGWKNSIEITNDQARVVVVPAIGRIMFYGFLDGDNILYNNAVYAGKTLPSNQPYMENGTMAWANFGGDKVWPTQQSEWPETNGHAWPPDHWFDGGAHTATLIENGVEITSGVSNYCGARSIRTIVLDPQGTRLTIHQKIEKLKKAQVLSTEPIHHTIWNITQIRPPSQTLFNLNPSSRFPTRYYLFDNGAGKNFTVDGTTGVFVPDPANSQKAGCDSDLWLAAIVGNTVIGEFYSFQTGAAYPDGGLSAEVYTCPQYTELELLSSFNQLAVGGQMESTIYWDLKQLSKGLSQQAQRDAAVQWLNEQVIQRP